MSDDAHEMLSEAVARNCAAVVSLPSAGLLRHQKSRFLTSDANGLWMEVSLDQKPLLEELVTSGAPVGISFKNGQLRTVFASPVLKFDAAFKLNAEVTVPAVLISAPESIKAIQRRSNYRVRVVSGSGVKVRVWRIAARAYLRDRPQPSQEILAELRNLSLGGIGVCLSNRDAKEPPKVTTEDRLRIELSQGETTLLLEGRMRNPSGPQPLHGINTGIQFKELTNDLEDRQNYHQLTRILGHLQREEARRARAAGA